MVVSLNWDTRMFGYPVGKLIVADPQNYTLEDIHKLSKAFRLVYVFSKSELQINSEYFFLADKKIVLKRDTELLADEFKWTAPYYGNVNEELLNLTLQSGIYSRFRTDSFFSNNEFLKLYTEWIKNSINRTIARDVYVYADQDEIKGFITLVVKGETAEIGLIAVNAKFRGHGIGSLLIRSAVTNARILGCDEIQVVTQQDNEPALALYKKNGFQICDLTYVYHYWNI